MCRRQEQRSGGGGGGGGGASGRGGGKGGEAGEGLTRVVGLDRYRCRRREVADRPASRGRRRASGGGRRPPSQRRATRWRLRGAGPARCGPAHGPRGVRLRRPAPRDCRELALCFAPRGSRKSQPGGLSPNRGPAPRTAPPSHGRPPSPTCEVPPEVHPRGVLSRVALSAGSSSGGGRWRAKTREPVRVLYRPSSSYGRRAPVWHAAAPRPRTDLGERSLLSGDRS